MTRVGIVGIGFMGMVHYLSYAKLQGIEVVAMCDNNPDRIKGDWTGIQGNFGPPGEQMDLSHLALYKTPSEMIADSNVDLIDITLPPLPARRHCDRSVRIWQARLLRKTDGDDRQ